VKKENQEEIGKLAYGWVGGKKENQEEIGKLAYGWVGGQMGKTRNK